MRKRGYIAACALTALLVVGGCGKGSKSTETVDTAAQEEAAATEAAPAEEAPAEVVFCDSDTMRVSLVDLREEPIVEGACYLYLDVENRTGSDVWFHPDVQASSVNGYNMIFAQGMPTYVNPGNKAIMGIILTYQQFGATSFDDVHEVDFDLVQENRETHEEIARTHVRVER